MSRRGGKYGNSKTQVDGIEFDSRKEASYYLYLKELLNDGTISNLRLQVAYELLPPIWREEVQQLKTKEKIVRKCIQRATHYVADFVYTDNKTGNEEVVDVKSRITRKKDAYILKKKMMLALKGIEIMEV